VSLRIASFLFLPCHFTTLLLYPVTHWHWDIISPALLWRYVIHQKKKTGLSLVQHQSLGDIWEELECLTAFPHPRANAPRLAKSLHLYHLGIFTEKKKRISSGFVVVFLLSRFGRRLLCLWACLERETDTNISHSDFAQQGGPYERERL
jgi:hypothetical protein